MDDDSGADCEEVSIASPRVDIAAFRPQTEGPGYDQPFPKKEVPASEETTPGVGIRANGDDDDGNHVIDRNDAGKVTEENDLIELSIKSLYPIAAQDMTGLKWILSRTSTDIAVYFDRSREFSLWQPTFASQLELDATAALRVNAIRTLWVEWRVPGGAGKSAELSLELVVAETGETLAVDTIRFSPFVGVVIAFGGNGEEPLSDNGPFQMARAVYDLFGYDVHAYSEEQAEEEAFQEVKNAIGTTDSTGLVISRDVTDVAIFGHSQGGGATYVLANLIQSLVATNATYTNAVKFTAYEDAITKDFITPETRRPPGASNYHVNYYQTNSAASFGLVGGPTTNSNFNLNINTVAGGEELHHTTIDDNRTVMNNIIDGTPPGATYGTHDGLLKKIKR